MRYFIGNWKMFGVPKSINILNKINSFYSKDKNRERYKAIITPPYTLIETYAKYFKNKKIIIGSQNCYQKDHFSSNTAVSPYMLRSVGAKYTSPVIQIIVVREIQMRCLKIKLNMPLKII